MLKWWGRKPLPDKGFRPYLGPMTPQQQQQVSDGPAVPLSLSVLRSGGAWVVQVWFHGSTVYEALHPVLVAENRLPPELVPLVCSWSTLWHQVALQLLDLADGKVSAHYQA